MLLGGTAPLVAGGCEGLEGQAAPRRGDPTAAAVPAAAVRVNAGAGAADERVETLPKHEPRGFSLQKASLFHVCQMCAMRRQRIEELDDAELDHVEEYWRGGRTIPENARLAHRFCNRSRLQPSRSAQP